MGKKDEKRSAVQRLYRRNMAEKTGRAEKGVRLSDPTPSDLHIVAEFKEWARGALAREDEGSRNLLAAFGKRKR